MRKILISVCLVGSTAIYADIGKIHTPGKFFTYEEWSATANNDEKDVLYLNDGSEIKGTIKDLPALYFGFGSVVLSPSDVALVSFTKVGTQIRGQYVTKAGENYIGALKTDSVKITIPVGSKGYGAESAINPRDINYILLSTNDSQTSHTNHFSLLFKNGDQLPFSPIKQTISLNENDKSIELPVDSIEEIIIERYVKGTVKDGNGWRELDRATLKDKLIGVYIPASKISVKIPWENIKRIQARRNGFIDLKESSNAVRTEKEFKPLAFAPEAFDALIDPALEPQPARKKLTPTSSDNSSGIAVFYGNSFGQILNSPEIDEAPREKSLPKKTPEVRVPVVQVEDKSIAFAAEAFIAFQQPLNIPSQTAKHVEPLFGDGSHGIPSGSIKKSLPNKTPDIQEPVVQVVEDKSIAFAAEAFIAFQQPLNIPSQSAKHVEPLFADGSHGITSKSITSLSPMTSLDVVKRKKEKPKPQEGSLIGRLLNQIESFDSPIEFTYDFDSKFDKPTFESIDSLPSFSDIAWLPADSQNNESDEHDVEKTSEDNSNNIVSLESVGVPIANSNENDSSDENNSSVKANNNEIDAIAFITNESLPSFTDFAWLPSNDQTKEDNQAGNEAQNDVNNNNIATLASVEVPIANANENTSSDEHNSSVKANNNEIDAVAFITNESLPSFTDFAWLPSNDQTKEDNQAGNEAQNDGNNNNIATLASVEVPIANANENPSSDEHNSSVKANNNEIEAVALITNESLPSFSDFAWLPVVDQIEENNHQEVDKTQNDGSNNNIASLASIEVPIANENDNNSSEESKANEIDVVAFIAHLTDDSATQTKNPEEDKPDDIALVDSKHLPEKTGDLSKDGKVTLSPEDILLINDELVFENLEFKDVDPVEFSVPADESVDDEEGFSPLNYRFTAQSQESADELVAIGPKIKKTDIVESDDNLAASFIWELISDKP